MHLLRAGAIENIEWLIRQNGHNPNEVLAEASLSSALLREPETLISYPKLADFLDYCAIICDDPLFGIHLAQIQSPLVLGEFASLLTQQRTLKDALEFAQKYIFLHAQGLQFEHSIAGERIEIRFVFDFTNNTGLKQLTQMSVGQQFEYAYSLSPGQNDRLQMHFTQTILTELEDALGEYKRHVVSNSHFDGISFPVSWLNVELSRDNTALDQYFQNRISALNERYPNDLASQVRYLCSNLLATGECSLESVAAALDLQPRALQRRLQKQGLSFRSQLQKVRQLRAEQYLRNSQMPITEIALNLGYAETAIFSRNFKEWSGLSPLKWRDLQRSRDNYR